MERKLWTQLSDGLSKIVLLPGPAMSLEFRWAGRLKRTSLKLVALVAVGGLLASCGGATEVPDALGVIEFGVQGPVNECTVMDEAFGCLDEEWQVLLEVSRDGDVVALIPTRVGGRVYLELEPGEYQIRARDRERPHVYPASFGVVGGGTIRGDVLWPFSEKRAEGREE